jgi:hypothetical protein
MILKTRKQRFGNEICFHPQVKGQTPTLMGSLENANLNYQPNQLGVGNSSGFQNTVFPVF